MRKTWAILPVGNKAYAVQKAFGISIIVTLRHASGDLVAVRLRRDTFTVVRPSSAPRPESVVLRRRIRVSANMSFTETREVERWFDDAEKAGVENKLQFPTARLLGEHLAGTFGQDIARDVLAAFLSAPKATPKKASTKPGVRTHESCFQRPYDKAAQRVENNRAAVQHASDMRRLGKLKTAAA